MRCFSQQGARSLAALLLCVPASLFAEKFVLQDVRHWTQNGITRVAIQLSGEAEVRRDRLSKPERYFFDFHQTDTNRKGMQTITVGDSLVRQIRIAEAKPGVARVVLDLAGDADVTTSELANPYRLIIEVKRPGAASAPPPAPTALPPAPAPAPVASKPPVNKKATRAFVPPPPHPVRTAAVALPAPPNMEASARNRRIVLPAAPKVVLPTTRNATPVTYAKATAPPQAATPPPAANPAQPAQSAKGRASGGNSMTRALGLKIRRVVIDPGHGGHDQGSSGPTGLLEKDVVLDVALRLGELIQNNLGSEIVYTRSEDQFVALEARTQIANESRADLFISIHANSSTIRNVSGVETYYLSFTTQKEALDVAARENATSQRSVFELRDLLQKIALQEKIEESKDFANRVNASLYRVWGQSQTTRNRGIKKAPFVVLIGASMPSILTEIGFISNPRDERELRRTETRQKIADALYRGIEQYAESLSHFNVARRGQGN